MIQTKEIKKWKIDHDVNHAMIAAKAGVTREMVSMVILGRRKSANVANVMVKMGCPKEFFWKGLGHESKKTIKKNG
jgi:hypothetical protein